MAVALAAGTAGTAVAESAGFVYALRHDTAGGTNEIYGFRLDAATGVLGPLPGFPVGSGGTGGVFSASEQLGYDSRHARLYVVNGGSATLSGFAVNRATGAITTLPFSPVALGPGQWRCVAVHPSGSPVVVGQGQPAGLLASFVVTATAATGAAGSPFDTGAARSNSCRFSRDGTAVYVGGGGGSLIAGFHVAAATGVLTPLPGSPFDSGNQFPMAYATDAAGRLFVAHFSDHVLRVFTSAAGVLAGVSGNPFPSGLTNAVHGVLHPAGFYMVADRHDVGRVGVYRIAGDGAATTLAAVPGSPFLSGGETTNVVALTPDGGLLVAANRSSLNLTVFRVDATTGGLTFLGVQPANALGAAGLLTGLVFVPGDLSVVVRGTDAGIYHNRFAGGAWTGFQGLPGASAGSPALVATGSGALDLVVRGVDGGIYHSRFDGTAWTGFTALPGATADVPALSTAGDGTLDLAVRGTDDGIYHSHFDGTTWTSFTALPGATIDGPALVATGGGGLELVIRGSDNGVYHSRFDGTTWTGFTALGGATAGPPALVTAGGGALDLVVRGIDDGVYHNHFDGVTWAGFAALPGATVDAPALATSRPGALDLVIRGTDNGVYHSRFDGATWTGFTALGGATAAGPALAATGGGALDLVIRGIDDGIYHNRFDGTAWGGFVAVGGSTTSRPALTVE